VARGADCVACERGTLLAGACENGSATQARRFFDAWQIVLLDARWHRRKGAI
jgi:hypothetical protein